MARFIRFAACQSSALPEAKASDTIRTKISNFRYKSSRSVSALAEMHQMTPTGLAYHSGEC